MIARNPKMGSFLKMEVFSVSEKTLACYKRDVKPCINKQTNNRWNLLELYQTFVVDQEYSGTYLYLKLNAGCLNIHSFVLIYSYDSCTC